MNPIGFRASTAPLVVWILSAGMVMAADNSNLTQVDWDTRTASCPARVTQSTNLIFRVTNINDLLIDFKTGERAQIQLRAKGTPVSVAPAENPFLPQIAVQGCPEDRVLLDHLNAVRAINDPRITPSQPGGPYISISLTINAAHSHPEVSQVESDYSNSSCAPFFSSHPADPVVQWIKRLDAQSTGGGMTPPVHSVDFNVNLEPNQNYEFTVQMFWKTKPVEGGTLKWNCGETDILTLSAGPLITTLPYRTYNQQLVPVTGGGTQNQLVVRGNSNVNVQGAALLNYHFPQTSVLPA